MSLNMIQTLTNLLFELGELRFTPRAHQQRLKQHDPSDNIATHSFYTAVIGFFLARLEEVDDKKVILMCLIHDWGETRTGDHNWVHRRYVEEREQQVLSEQLNKVPAAGELQSLTREFLASETPEAKVAHDADQLAEILSLREYVEAGNREADRWLKNKGGGSCLDHLRTESGREWGRAVYERPASDWWTDLFQSDKNSI